MIGTLKWNRLVTLARARVAALGWMLAMVLVLAGCAGAEAFREGKALLAEGRTEQGLSKLEEAVEHDPRNAEYRIVLAGMRTTAIQRLLAVGDASRREGRLTDAEKAYRRVQGLDPENAMARQGLEALVKERQHRQALAEAEALFKKGAAADLADALELLRPILAENPRHNEARKLKARVDEALYKAQRPDARLAATFRKPISLAFRDAPLRSILEVVAQVSGLNFFYDKDIRPDLKATIFAKNTTIEDALRLVLVTNQLEQKILNENSILIYPSTPQKLKEYQTLVVRTFYLANADVKAVSNTLKTIARIKDMSIDERLGIIFVRDTPEAVRMAERIVKLQDLSDPEVMLEVEIMEVKRSRLLELGIQWPGQLSLSPLQLSGVPLTLETLRNLTQSTTQVTVGGITINARKEDHDANILANPRIRVRNKDKAKILIGDRVPVITTTSTSTGFVSESVNYVDVGLKLEVEPNIYLDEEVAIKVNLEVSSLVREVLSKTGTLSYQIGTRQADTVLRLRDGETQILAGLISDEDRAGANKVPLIGEVPLLGRLFGTHKDDTQRSEILLSITPRVVRSINRPDLLAAEFESGTDASIGAPSLRLTSLAADVGEPPGERAEAAPGKVGAVGGGAAAKPPAEPVADAVVTPVTATSAPIGPTPVLAWQAPAQVRAGEQFSVVLNVESQGALRGLPLLVGFDPLALQVVSVQEGDFFSQAGGTTNFSHRIDPGQGKVFVAVVRQNASGNDAGVNGTGSLVTVTFKALKAGPARLQLLSASPEPAPPTPVALPVERVVRVEPPARTGG